MSDTRPALGSIGVTPTYGSKFDKFVGGAIRFITATEVEYHGWKNAPVNHAVVYVGNDEIVEAQPGGANLSPWDSYGSDMIWLNEVWQFDRFMDSVHNAENLLVPTKQQRDVIAETARDLAARNIGYGYLDFLGIALAQHRLGQVVNPASPPWWARRLADDSHMICSQLADYSWQRAGLKIFGDGRAAGFVTPEDLYLAGNLPAHA